MKKNNKISYFADEAISALEKQIKEYKKTGKPVLVLCDTHTQTHCLPLLQQYIPFDFITDVLMIPVGEENKNIETATRLWQELSDKNVDKTAILLCLGGGVVCDMGGFVGATFKRGMNYAFIPTSLTAQIDASIGGKTAVNLNGIKNQIGVFHQPKTVFTIPAFLETLPEREIFSGFAEMLKHGLIADKTYWEELIKIFQAPQMTQPELIKKSIQIKTAICHADPYEMGERKKLNFGHSIGHALESFALFTGQALSHGEAVAWGMMVESHLSYQKKGINEAELAVILEVLSRFVQPFPIEKKDYAVLFSYLQKDKKKVNNNLNFTLLNAIGSAVINQQVSWEEVEWALEMGMSVK